MKRIHLRYRGSEMDFLYHMVRILTGTLLDVGIGKIKAEEIPEILKAKDRKKSGFPAPAKGLFLGRVFYTEAELKKKRYRRSAKNKNQRNGGKRRDEVYFMECKWNPCMCAERIYGFF